jgi:hypothetical protein
MPISLLSLFIGFVGGVIATAIAWNLSQKSVRNPETAKLTALWSLNDIAEPGTRPAVLAETVEGLTLPAGTKVIVPRDRLEAVPSQVLSTCEVRMHAEVRVNAAVGKDRALVFSGHVSPKAFAVFTRDEHTVRLLQSDFQRMWADSDPYVERVGAIADLSGKDGRVVDVTGKAIELMEYRGRKMLRLTDGKYNVGVVTKQADVAAFQGGTVRVVGRMRRENGYAFLEADRLALVQQASA